ncbi:MAG TPA: hypothetical protein VEA41_07945 [Salinarimonas sp.]|nr:hypothetical protein [Salinarimonas sp.]
MTPDLLRRVGAAFYGQWFVKPLAEGLGVTERTLHRWLAGSHPIPPTLHMELRGLASDRKLEIEAVLRELPS